MNRVNCFDEAALRNLGYFGDFPFVKGAICGHDGKRRVFHAKLFFHIAAPQGIDGTREFEAILCLAHTGNNFPREVINDIAKRIDNNKGPHDESIRHGYTRRSNSTLHGALQPKELTNRGPDPYTDAALFHLNGRIQAGFVAPLRCRSRLAVPEGEVKYDGRGYDGDFHDTDVKAHPFFFEIPHDAGCSIEPEARAAGEKYCVYFFDNVIYAECIDLARACRTPANVHAADPALFTEYNRAARITGVIRSVANPDALYIGDRITHG